MFTHHLKISFRNLWKYKTQNIISIIGLAVGFVCFSLSAMWIRYERSYDGFHPKADRIYLVQDHPRKWDTQNADASVTSQYTSYPAALYLKTNFPEIEDVCAFREGWGEKISIIYADSSFFNIFDLPKPSNDFFVRGTIKPAIITEDFTATNVLEEEQELYVKSVIPRWTPNTNIPFQVISPLWVTYSEKELSIPDKPWLPSSGGVTSFKTFVLLRKNIDIQRLEEKLDSIMLVNAMTPVSLSLVPIRKLRYIDPEMKLKNDIKFSHIYIFSLSGLLVILCALFNHTTLYVTQMQMRMREFALRKVNGSSNGQIIQLLYLEFLFVQLISLVAGALLLALCIPYFREYAGIGSSGFHIFTELLAYAVSIIIFASLSGLFPILHFRKQTLQATIQQQHAARNKNMFRKVSLILQLTISIGLLFCSLVILKQMKYLTGAADLGIDRHNVASVYADCCPLTDSYYKDKLKQIPGITDVLTVMGPGFLKDIYTGSMTTSTTFSNKLESSIAFELIQVDNHFFEFFNIDIIEGRKFSHEYQATDSWRSEGEMVVNETMAKGFENNIIGQPIGARYKVVGIARDFFITPTTKVKPAAICYPEPYKPSSYFDDRLKALAYRYEEGMRRQTQQAVTQWMRNEFPGDGGFEIKFTYMEEVFEEYFKSERALLFLLSITTGVCILIAVFGVYSLTSLTCRQRRKEIAIRKVHGAEILDIMNIFFKEYLLMLAIAALAAFPAGYIIMKRWLEGYVKQTSMDAWLFVLIFLIVFAVIVFSIFSTVWKAANQNPADMVKSE